MKLKEFVHACNCKLIRETVEITVDIFKSDFEKFVTLFTLKGDNLEYGCINERFTNAEVKFIYATEKNKFSVIIQPD
ncbi:MAG: hypothetical protein K2J36_02560 [Ruminococcus sp.]|nr:hypothetical protein [Ruminococcus sp.]